MPAEDEKAYLRKFFLVSFLIAGVPVAIDVADGSFLFSFAVCSIWLLFALLVAVINVLGRVNEWRALLTFAAIPLVTFLLVFGIALLQNSVARSNALRIVHAAQQYGAKNGALPQRLDDLVPTYLPYVPLAKYAVLGRFEYLTSSGSHILLWTSVPPFLRCTYRLEDRRLVCLD